MSSDKVRIAVYSLDLPRYACPQIRIIRPFERLRSHFEVKWGVQHHGNDAAIALDALKWADMVIIQRYFPLKETWPVVEAILSSGKPVVYDIDDLLIDIPHDHPRYETLRHTGEYVLKLLPLVQAVTVPSPVLKDELKALNANVHVLPNLIDDQLWVSPVRGVRDRLVIGFAGTDSHVQDLEMIEPALVRLLQTYQGKVELLMFGCTLPNLEHGEHARFIPFEDGYITYARALCSLAFDIGLAPLADSRFNRAKSDVKCREYAAVQAAGVYSAVGPYQKGVEQGATGLVVGNSSKEWFEALSRLVEDREFREHLARQAHKQLHRQGTLRAKVAQYRDFYQTLAA